MASLQETYQIIHSLNKYEKIQLNLYFNTFATKAKNSYINDYQCFVKEKVYDKEKITKALNKVKLRKNLSESNTNLYNFVLDSLVKINLNKDEKIGLLKEIQSVEMLFKKGLLEQSEKKLNQIKKGLLTTKQERIKFYLYDIENELLLRKEKSKNIYDSRISIIDEQINFTDKAGFVLKIRKLKTQLFALMARIGLPRSKDNQNEYLDLINDKILQLKNESVPKSAYLDFFYSKFMLQLIADPINNEKALVYLKEGLELVKKNVNIKDNYLPFYILSGMMMQACSVGKNEEASKKSIQKFEKIIPFIKSEQLQVASKSELHTGYLLSSLTFNKIQEGYEYITINKEAILNQENLKFSPHSYANYLSCARICFLQKDYEQSLEFIDLLLAMKNKIRKSLHTPINLLYLLNHLKLNNTVYMPYALRSAYRSLLKTDKLYEPEKAILTFFRKSINLVDYKGELEKLYAVLVDLKKIPFNNSFYGNGDYIKWLEIELEIIKAPAK